jgi:galactose mutarotase-like enzyme
MIEIENDFLRVAIKPFGAELCSIINKKNNLEYLWQAGKEWAKHAPVLFPIVGQLKENKYFFSGKEYKMERHGFGRSSKFETGNLNDDSAEFILKSDNETLKVFPFPFQLKIIYTLSQNKLVVKYAMENIGDLEMYFSIGAHPAFKIPLAKKENYEDYFLEFNKVENLFRYKLKDGLISDETEMVLNSSNKLPLTKKLFYNDALVFKNLASNIISIKNNKSAHGLHFNFEGFPFFGIWAAKDADFICLEPWYGIADSVNHNQRLENKEGIIKLESGKTFRCHYSIELF